MIDPCYLSEYKDGEFTPDKKTDDFSYNSVSHATIEKLAGGVGDGVAFSTGLGDGAYDVYAEIIDHPDWGKRVKSITVQFL